MSERELGQSAAHRLPLPWWVSTIVVVCALLMAMGAVLALVNPGMLASPGETINGAVRVYAGYVFSRNLAVAAMLLATMITGSRRGLVSMMILTAVIQVLDAVMDCFEARWSLVPGVLVLAFLLLLGARSLNRCAGSEPLSS